MLELIRDLAPGASLAFATANGGQANFANNIRALANPAEGDATVIVDDAGYLNEPMFQDGVIAQAIDEVVTTRGVSYFSAAGNRNGQAYESTTFQTHDRHAHPPERHAGHRHVLRLRHRRRRRHAAAHHPPGQRRAAAELPVGRPVLQTQADPATSTPTWTSS